MDLLEKIKEKYTIDEIQDEQDNEIKVVSFSNYMCEITFTEKDGVEIMFNVDLDPNEAVLIYSDILNMLNNEIPCIPSQNGYRLLENGLFEYDEDVTKKGVYDRFGKIKYSAK